jgi:anti-sigma regulatory factor (Ser/Thr protein kinase)
MNAEEQPGAGAVGAAAHPGSLHAASIYRRNADGVASVVSFAQEGLARGEAVSIGVLAPLGRLLRRALGERGPRVAFFDMAELGRNPGRIIPAMLDFAAAHADRRIRYVSQPFWPGRSAAEAVEAMRHEALVNLAFAQANAAILCLYDTGELGPQVTSAAEETHPTVIRDGQVRASLRYAGGGQIPPACNRPLAPPPPRVRSLFYQHDLRPVRQRVARCAQEAGLTADRAADLMLAVSEVAANTLRHTTGGGTLWVWPTPGEVVCQVQDSGNVADPLAGRWGPADRLSGHGLWVVNQLCDLVELRTGPDGTVVRMHMCL